jgi:hypothetical protein
LYSEFINKAIQSYACRSVFWFGCLISKARAGLVEIFQAFVNFVSSDFSSKVLLAAHFFVGEFTVAIN